MIGDRAFTKSYIVWGTWFLAFVALELLAIFHVMPWINSDWGIGGIASIIKIVFHLGLVVFTAHIVYRWHQTMSRTPQKARK